MHQKQYFLGIDVGTSSVKIGLFDHKGYPIAFESEAFSLTTPKSGWAEQNVYEWWNAICTASIRLMNNNDVDKKSILGMSLDSTCCTVVCLDKQMKVIRPAILWMDVRASKQAKAITSIGHDVLKYVGYGNVSAEMMPAKVLWLKENERENYDKSKYIMECTDWLLYKLTGELNASIAACSPRWLFDKNDEGSSLDFYKQCGIEDVIEKYPNDILSMGTKIGTLSKKSADAMGLIPGIPVGEGGPDAFVGMIGLNVVNPRKVAMITGTSHLLLSLVEKELHSEGIWGSYPDAIVKGHQLIEGGQTSTGSIIEWFKKNFMANIEQDAKAQGKSTYDLLEEVAKDIPVGAEGLLALDYFQGNRAPYADPDVRGMIYGLSLNHTPYHIYRAIIESICYGTENIINSFKKSGTATTGIYVAGGAVKSSFWLQIHSDVSNVPLFIPEVTEAPCLGSAILGAVSSGFYPDIQSASNEMVRFKEIIEPNSLKTDEYKFFFDKYIEAYEKSKDWMHEVTKRG